jgi:hypothetical protein
MTAHTLPLTSPPPPRCGPRSPEEVREREALIMEARAVLGRAADLIHQVEPERRDDNQVRE